MKSISFYSGFALLLVGLGIVYFSRFCLRNHKKLKGKDLEAIKPRFQGIKRSYLTSNFVTMLFVTFLAFAVYLTREILIMMKYSSLA